jgi:elongation factor P
MGNIDYNEMRIGTMFRKNEDPDPWVVTEYAFIRMQQRKPVAQLKIKNLLSGKAVDYTAHQNDNFYEIDIEEKKSIFIYKTKDEYWFHELGKPAARFSLPAETVGKAGEFLKANTQIKSFEYEGKIIKVDVPVKMDLKVKEAPPAIKGDTAQGGTKQVVLETGAVVSAPLFINEGDILRINTSTGEYTERMEKA